MSAPLYPIISCRPDFGNTVSASFKCKTVVCESISGKEERISCQQRPLLGLSFVAKNMTNTETKEVRSLINARGENPVACPVWIDAVTITANAAIAQSVLTCKIQNRLFPWFQYALIWQGFGEYEVVKIASFTETAVTLQAAITSEVRAGAYLVPLALGHMAIAPSEYINANVSELSLEFEERPGFVLYEGDTLQTVAQLQPLTSVGEVEAGVFPVNPDWGVAPDYGATDDLTLEAINGGAPRPWQTFTPRKTLSYTYKTSREGLQRVLRHFTLNDGKRGAFTVVPPPPNEPLTVRYQEDELSVELLSGNLFAFDCDFIQANIDPPQSETHTHVDDETSKIAYLYKFTGGASQPLRVANWGYGIGTDLDNLLEDDSQTLQNYEVNEIARPEAAELIANQVIVRTAIPSNADGAYIVYCSNAENSIKIRVAFTISGESISAASLITGGSRTITASKIAFHSGAGSVYAVFFTFYFDDARETPTSLSAKLLTNVGAGGEYVSGWYVDYYDTNEGDAFENNNINAVQITPEIASLSESWTPGDIVHGAIEYSAEMLGEEIEVRCNGATREQILTFTAWPELEIFRADMSQTPPAIVSIFKGVIVSQSLGAGGEMSLKLSSKLMVLDQKTTQYKLQRQCNYKLFSNPCRLAPITVEFEIESGVPSREHHTITFPRGYVAHYFTGGTITSETGEKVTILKDAGVDESNSRSLTLDAQIGPGRYSITPWCDKSEKCCAVRFGNIQNFGGFPYLPSNNPVEQVSLDSALGGKK